jgi:hypothetical protein
VIFDEVSLIRRIGTLFWHVMINPKPFTLSGKVRVQYLLNDINSDLVKEFKDDSVNSNGIWSIS